MVRMALAFLILVSASTLSRAASDSDAAAIRDVIEQQLEAFQHDDAIAAFGLAAPNIHTMFGEADRFMGMVKNGYPPVYRPKSHAFLDLKEPDGTILQSLRIEDGAGELWTAIYAMEKQPDGSWKISGCWLVKAPTTGA